MLASHAAGLVVLATFALAGDPPTAAPAAPPPTRAPAEEAGFKSLFNGKDFTGWIGDTKGYVIEDGAIVCGPHGTNLVTQEEFGDFSFRFEFKLTPGANNGIGVRTPAQGDAAYVGMEIQVLDNSAAQYASLKPYQFHGSIYGVAAAKREFLKPVGEWNSEEIIANGRRLKVVLNGEAIVDVDLDDVSKNGTLDGKEHPGLKNAKGHLALCGHGDRVMFRNLRIKAGG